MPTLTASPLTAGTATAVIVLTVTLALLALEYRGDRFVVWFRTNRGSAAIVGGIALGLGVSLASFATSLRPPLIAWTASAVAVLAGALLGLGLEYRHEVFALRPASLSGGTDFSRGRASPRSIGRYVGRSRPLGRSSVRNDAPTPPHRLPSSVRTLGDLLYWQYARIISGPAGTGKRPHAFARDRFEKLRSGRIRWEGIHEYVKEREDPSRCLFCGGESALTMDHMIPSPSAGPHVEKNAIWLCTSCSSSKGDRGFYEYWTERRGPEGAQYDLARPAEGKYLTLLQELLGPGGFLAWKERDLRRKVCPSCPLQSTCRAQGSEGRLSPLCLDAVAGVAFGGPSLN